MHSAGKAACRECPPQQPPTCVTECREHGSHRAKCIGEHHACRGGRRLDGIVPVVPGPVSGPETGTG